MSEQTMPPAPETDAAKASKSKAKPEFVFVLNETRGPRTLNYREPDVQGHAPATSKILGPGLNWVAASIVDRCTAKGEEFGAVFGGEVRVVDPTKLLTRDAQDQAKHCASRQAAREWRKIERRPDVVAALDERLKPKPVQAAPIEPIED